MNIWIKQKYLEHLKCIICYSPLFNFKWDFCSGIVIFYLPEIPEKNESYLFIYTLSLIPPCMPFLCDTITTTRLIWNSKQACYWNANSPECLHWERPGKLIWVKNDHFEKLLPNLRRKWQNVLRIFPCVCMDSMYITSHTTEDNDH